MSDTNGTQIDLAESNGKIRESDAAAPHQHELGAVVEVDVELSQVGECTEIALKGSCKLIVVGHLRDRYMTPLYILSDFPVVYPHEADAFSEEKLVYRYMATLVESGYGEESLRSTEKKVPLKATVAEWFEEAAED